MEGLVILVVLAMAGGVIVLPLVAFLRSARAIREVEYLRQKLASIEAVLSRREAGPAPAPPRPPEAASQTPVAAEPSVFAPANLPVAPAASAPRGTTPAEFQQHSLLNPRQNPQGR
jgi:hypothetical protein